LPGRPVSPRLPRRPVRPGLPGLAVQGARTAPTLPVKRISLHGNGGLGVAATARPPATRTTSEHVVNARSRGLRGLCMVMFLSDPSPGLAGSRIASDQQGVGSKRPTHWGSTRCRPTLRPSASLTRSLSTRVPVRACWIEERRRCPKRSELIGGSHDREQRERLQAVIRPGAVSRQASRASARSSAS
jgi:hypothetical protein